MANKPSKKDSAKMLRSIVGMINLYDEICIDERIPEPVREDYKEKFQQLLDRSS